MGNGATRHVNIRILNKEIKKMRRNAKIEANRKLKCDVLSNSSYGVGGHVVVEYYHTYDLIKRRKKIIDLLYQNTIDYLQFVHDTFEKVDANLAKKS